jgi:NAD(P)-dependent dehydrogenase (short-subunit alcohol dehydrogenase family)
MQRLEDKIALVTGSGAGIGESICLRFASEGACVVGMDRNQIEAERVADTINANGFRAYAQTGDVSKKTDCTRVVKWIMSTFGNIHVLCNVAGIVEGGTLLDVSDEIWRRTMDINLKGMYYLCKLVVQEMIRQDGGSIINISSVAGLIGLKNRAVYSVSKAGINALTKSVAADFIKKGIRANAICPGVIESPSWKERVNTSPDPEKALQDFIDQVPMGRVGKPEEVAALAAYLASDESAFMTGQAISIDGGKTM